MGKKHYPALIVFSLVPFMTSVMLISASTLSRLKEESILVPGNGIQRVLTIERSRLRTRELKNDIIGRKVSVSGPEFVITCGGGEGYSSDDFEVLDLSPFSGGATAKLKSKELGLLAEIKYSSSPGRPWLYKQIRFSNIGPGSLLLRTVELERLKVDEERISYAVNQRKENLQEIKSEVEEARRKGDLGYRGLQIYADLEANHGFSRISDWGQPVYTESLWFGVEFPATRSGAVGDTLFLRHHPGVDLTTGESYLTKRAVVGAASTEGVEEAFLDYVATFPGDGKGPEMHIYWDGFRVIKPPQRLAQGLAMIGWAKRLKEDFDFSFDSWTYDAGFDMYRPDGLFVPREAQIWERTAEALAPIGTPLGFWASFSPIYDTPTHEWGKRQGYELQHRSSYCLAGPNYFSAVKNRLEEIVRRYQMGSVNFDGMYWGQGFGCNEQGHGHLVGEGPETGVYSTERVVENKLKIFRALRRLRPEIILDLFICGEWASPWWLMDVDGVHTVWGDTTAAGIPSPWLRDELITVRDIQVFEVHRKLKRQFPLWAEDLYGTQVRKDHLIDGLIVKGEPTVERWEDEYVMGLPGRGTISAHLMVADLELLASSRGGLRFLAEVAQWTKRNESLYEDFHLLGEDPRERQPYGYAHCDGQGRAVVALRNPDIRQAVFPLVVDESLGLRSTQEKIFVNIVYPYRKTFLPIRFGETVEVLLKDFEVMLLELRFQSRQFKDIYMAGRWSMDDSGEVFLVDETPLESPPAGHLRVVEGGEALLLTGEILVPETARAGQLQVMLHKTGDGSSWEVPELTVDGARYDVSFHERRRNPREAWAHAASPSSWAMADVGPGLHRIEMVISGLNHVDVGAWLVGAYTLERHPGNIETNLSEDLFPVIADLEDRLITTLLAPRSISREY